MHQKLILNPGNWSFFNENQMGTAVPLPRGQETPSQAFSRDADARVMKTRNLLLALCIANCAPSADEDEGSVDLAATVPGMIQVGASSFLMGCNTRVDTGCRADEYPGHTIKLAGYYID